MDYNNKEKTFIYAWYMPSSEQTNKMNTIETKNEWFNEWSPLKENINNF